jgi:hypothetical protein
MARFENWNIQEPEHFSFAGTISPPPMEKKMKRLLLIGFAACAFAAMPTLSASAMPVAAPDAMMAGTDSVILARGGHGHGRGHMGRGGRGHHYGWGRGRGHHYGWSRGRHRGW